MKGSWTKTNIPNRRLGCGLAAASVCVVYHGGWRSIAVFVVQQQLFQIQVSDFPRRGWELMHRVYQSVIWTITTTTINLVAGNLANWCASVPCGLHMLLLCTHILEVRYESFPGEVNIQNSRFSSSSMLSVSTAVRYVTASAFGYDTERALCPRKYKKLVRQ